MEFISGGDLLFHLTNMGTFSEKQARCVFAVHNSMFSKFSGQILCCRDCIRIELLTF